MDLYFTLTSDWTTLQATLIRNDKPASEVDHYCQIRCACNTRHSRKLIIERHRILSMYSIILPSEQAVDDFKRHTGTGSSKISSDSGTPLVLKII